MRGQGQSDAVVLDVGGDEYETRVTRLESRPDTSIVAILQKPLEVGLAPFRALTRVSYEESPSLALGAQGFLARVKRRLRRKSSKARRTSSCGQVMRRGNLPIFWR